MSKNTTNNRKGVTKRQGRQRSMQVRQERLFARIVSGEGQIAFTDITSHLGQPCPFSKPQAFMAMRASEEVCSFHLLHLTKKKSKAFGSSETTMPEGGLNRLERRARNHDMKVGDLVIELSTYVSEEEPVVDSQDGGLEALFSSIGTPAPAVEAGGLDDLFGAPATESGALDDLFGGSEEAPATEEVRERKPRQSTVSTWKYSIARSDSGLASVTPQGEEVYIDLDIRPVRASVYMVSPVTNKPVGLSFIGFVGKAGDEYSLSRIAGKILASALHLPAFQAITGLSGMVIDSDEDTGVDLVASVGTPKFNFKVYAFEAAGASGPSVTGYVEATANLEYADAVRGRLHFDFKPEGALAAGFGEKYGSHVSGALSSIIRDIIGEAGMHQIVRDIVNGGVTTSTVEQIIEAGEQVIGIDVTSEGQWRQHS